MMHGAPLVQPGDLTTGLSRWGDRIALHWGNSSLSYRQLSQAMVQRSAHWQHAGLTRRALCILPFAIHPDAIIDYLTALHLRLPVLLLDPALPDDRRASWIKQLDAEWQLAGSQPPRRLAHSAQSAELCPDLAVLLLTSGSSGQGKAVMLSRDNLNSNAQAIAQFQQLEADHSAITALPLFYSYGLSVLNSHLSVGASICLTDATPLQKPFWQAMLAHQVTQLPGVPFSYQLYRRLKLADMSLPHLRQLTQAGGRLPIADATYFHSIAAQQGWTFYLMYGQTEATARMTFVPPDTLPASADGIGVPIPGGCIRLRDLQNGEDINTPGISGELCYQGPNVMLGYAQHRVDLQSAAPQSELATGDLAEYTPDGWLRITGRISRLLKLRGKRWQLDELEQHLSTQIQHPVVCCGDDDRLIIAWDGADREHLAQTLHQELGIHPTLCRFLVLAEPPRLASGKIDYTALCALVDQ